MGREDTKRRDEKWEALKRRVQLLARLDGATVLLEEGVHVVAIERVRDPDGIVKRLRDHGMLDRATLEASVEAERPSVHVTPALLATAQRDVRALATPPARALAREHKKMLVRFGVIDDAWLAAKQRRITALADLIARAERRTPDAWFEGVVEIVRAVHGAESAARLDDARARLTALGAERRRRATERIEALVDALEGGPPTRDVDLLERLLAARSVPGRARRARVIDVLRKAAAWPDAPASAAAALAGRIDDFARAVREAGRAVVRAMPAGRDPVARMRVLDLLSFYGLLFRIGDDGVPVPSDKQLNDLLLFRSGARELERTRVTLGQAVALLELKVERHHRVRLAKLVGDGLEIDLVAKATASGHAEALARAANVRAARAFATWATKLVPHYKALGITIPLTPELFANLPRHEDLAVLGLCLMEHPTDAKGTDPVEVLDATLGFFQRMPARAGGIISRLRGSDPGGGRRAFPDFADWLDDDALLDRYVHVARIAGMPVTLTKQLREDFEHAAKATREREHLEQMPSRHARQEARLATLRRAERTLAGAPVARTRRRIAERIERLLPVAYRRELDSAFREIMREAWGIAVPSLTQAWRDAVRFWLVVDDNRDLLGKLLRAAAVNPGRDVKQTFEKNRAWIEKARAKFDVTAWLAPRHDEFVIEGARYLISLEEDPLEVLRMGIPFGTCLALDEGCNAASTVSNALDANKRVLYVRTRDGKIVARKLLAVSKDFRLLGYNVYVSVQGTHEPAIREAVRRACQAILDSTGLEPTIAGEPEAILGGFWYDDGAVAFDADVDIATYCRVLGLAPVPKWFDAIAVEARGHAAMQNGDVDAAVRHVTRWDSGPANVALGDFIVSRIGEREAERRARDTSALVGPILRSITASGDDGIVRALATATRLDEWASAQNLGDLLARFPKNDRIARALADLAVRAVRVFPGSTDHGLAHMTIDEVPAMIDGIAVAFDVLDTVDAPWADLVRRSPGCERCVQRAHDAIFAAMERAFVGAPDEDAVVTCLMSRHRSAASQRGALRIASKHALANGARALGRLASLRPELARSPEMLAATIVQNGLHRIDSFGEIDAPPFETLGPLLFACDGLEAILARWPQGRLDDWQPGPWELAWLRRQPRSDLRDRLEGDAMRAKSFDTPRSMELLALLADVEALERVAARSEDWSSYAPKDPRVTVSKLFKYRTEALATAKTLARQVAAADAGRVCPVGTTSFVDRRLADVAIDLLRSPPPSRARIVDERALAVEILVATTAPIDFQPILVDLAARGDDESLARILRSKPPTSDLLEHATIVALWQREKVRAEVAEALARGSIDTWSARAWACERVAERDGLDVDGLLEAWALAMLEKGSSHVADVETIDQLRSVVRVVVDRAPPAQAISFYQQLHDELSASFFVKAVRRAPRDRAAALREAAAKMGTGGSRAARKAWLEATRSVSSTPAQPRASQSA